MKPNSILLAYAIDFDTGKRVNRYIHKTLLATGLSILLLNIYGLTQSLRPEPFLDKDLRFGGIDVSLSLTEFQNQINKMSGENDLDYAKRITKVIANGIAHIHWGTYAPDKFNQLIPIWENYILWTMGKLEVIPEYKRYHFTNIDKSIERGIGVCGDVSILMSQLLDKYEIENRIITMPGHVMVEARFSESIYVFDPDFGVILENSAENFFNRPNLIGSAYSEEGHSETDDVFIQKAFSSGVTYWNGVSHFLTKKYYFEKVSYALKWFIPFAFIILGWLLLKKSTENKTNA